MNTSRNRLLSSLPVETWQKIEQLSLRTGESPAEIVTAAINLYEKTAGGEGTPLEDEEKLRIYREVASLVGKNSATLLSPDQRATRAQAGGVARSQSMTAAQRKEIARKAAQKRWGKKPSS